MNCLRIMSSVTPLASAAGLVLLKKKPPRPKPGRITVRISGSAGLLPQQLEHALRRRVRQAQDLRRGGHENLRAGERGGFTGEIGVPDRAFGGGRVLDGDAEAADGGAHGVLLEGAQAPAERGDLLDGLVHDLLSDIALAVDEVVGLAGGEGAEQAVGAVAQLAGGDVADAEADLAGDVDLAGELEVGAAAGELHR